MKPKQCPECKEYLSEDEQTYYCTECDYEEFKTRKVWWEET